MKIGRRPVFFAALCLICLILIPATPEEFWWVNYSMAGLAAFWSVVIGLEDISAGREAERRRPRNDRPSS